MTSIAPVAMQRYDRTSVMLHWAIALLIAGNGVLALMIDNWPREERPPILNIHALFGVLALVLTLWRILNRRANPAPALPPGPAWMEKASKAGHHALYLLTFLIPLSGAPALWVRGRALNLGLFEIPSPLAQQPRPVVGQVTEIHEWMFWLTVAVIAGHIAAALWHQFSLKDRLLERMRF